MILFYDRRNTHYAGTSVAPCVINNQKSILSERQHTYLDMSNYTYVNIQNTCNFMIYGSIKFKSYLIFIYYVDYFNHHACTVVHIY